MYSLEEDVTSRPIRSESGMTCLSNWVILSSSKYKESYLDKQQHSISQGLRTMVHVQVLKSHECNCIENNIVLSG